MNKKVKKPESSKKNQVKVEKKSKREITIKNIIFILIAIFIIIIIFVLSTNTKSNKDNDGIFNFGSTGYSNITAIGLYEYEASLNYDGTSIIFFCSNEEKKCQEELEALNDLANDNNITIEYLNILELVDSELEELKNTSSIFEKNEYPHLLIIKNKQIVNNSSKYLNKSEIEEILKKYEIIK